MFASLATLARSQLNVKSALAWMKKKRLRRNEKIKANRASETGKKG